MVMSVGGLQQTARLGERLLQRKLITQAQLDAALTEQRSSRAFLGAILVRHGWVAPQALLTALSEQFGIPCGAVDPSHVDWSVADQFPASALAGGTCFPVRADARTVTVAVANPLEVWGLSQLEPAALPRRLARVLVSEENLQQLVEAHRQRVLSKLQSQLKRAT